MPRYRVLCKDDRTRHVEPFRTFEEAQRWAEWGHACTRRHQILTVMNHPYDRPQIDGGMPFP